MQGSVLLWPLEVTLPSLEDICSLKHPTIRFIPSSARPAFARALSSVLKEIVAVNSVAAWTKLLMLPKCVLPTSKRGGHHNKPISIDILCDMWLKGNLCELWLRAQTRATISTQSKKVLPNKRVDSAIALAKDGLYSKACQMLTSQGLAPDDDNTWNLLTSKHPQGECPSNLPIPSTETVLTHDFNIVPVLRSFSKLTGAGPTGLRIQHLIDAAEVPLSCSILQSLKGVVNILAAGRAPPMIASFLAGGNLTALVKSKQGSSLDIRPIAVGEALRRFTGKCLCALVRSKASEFFQPHQFGVACPMGAEKIVHGLRACVEKHWLEENLVVLKVDMKNAFNLVSRQALLSECAKHFPELYPWAHWCYSQHPYLWHMMGNLTSECGVQQGDPLGPLLFSLVLNILVSEIVLEPGCANLLYHAWYLDDGVVAGSSTEVCRVLAILEERGHSLGLHVNINKCEVFCYSDLSHFPPSMKQSHQPNIEILGIPIGDLDFCTTFISHKHGLAKQLMLQIEEVGALDPQVALMLLRTCSGFFKLSHLARATPPSLSVKALELFNQDVRSCLSQSTLVDLTDVSWNQAQLSLSRGGLSMRSLMLHAPAAYIASVCSSGYGLQSLTHLTHAVEMFNVCVAPADKISLDSLASSNINQKMLSSKLDDYQLQGIFNRSSVADRARLLSISAPHSSSWLSVVPSEGLGLHFEPNQYNVALKWWLGLDTSCGSSCAFCPDSILDPLGHHASTCKRGRDAVHRHNLQRDVFADSCRLAHLPVKLEVVII
ncbi:hypothetical protein EMCRGX_G006859 [Ephydatia muelleri]